MHETSKIAVELLAFAETISDAEQVVTYLTQRRIDPAQVKIVALTLEAEHSLASTVWPTLFLRELTALEEALPHLYAKAEALADIWHQVLELKDDFYEQVVAPQYRYFFYHALVCQHVLDETFKTIAPENVLLLPFTPLPLNAHMELHQSFPGYTSLFNALLRGYCRQHHISIIETAPFASLRRVAWRMHPWQRIAARIWAEVPNAGRLLTIIGQTARAALSSLPNRSKSEQYRQPDQESFDVLITNWGGDLERNLRFSDVVAHPAFSDLRILHQVMGQKPLPALQTQQNQRIERLGRTDVTPRELVAGFLWNVFAKRWRRFQRRRRALARAHGAWFAERQLDYLFITIFFEAYLEAFLCRLNVDKWVREYQLQVLVSSDVHTGTCRAYFLAAKEHGLTTLSTNHGFYMVEPPRSNFLADCCLVGGPALRRNLMRSGVPAERIQIIGNSSFDPLLKITARAVEECPTILIIPYPALDLVSYKYRQTEYFQTMKNVCDLATANDAWQVVIKAHPAGDSVDLYGAIVAQLQRPNLRLATGRWPREQFQQAAVAVAFADSSSLLELQSYGIPIVFIEGFIPPYYHPHVAGCGVTVTTAPEAVQAVSQLLTDSVFRQQVVDQGYSYLQSYTDMPNNGVERFAQVLHQYVREPTLASNEGLHHHDI